MMKKKISPQTGILCISTTLNNIFVNLTTLEGNTLYVVSSGGLGFKGSKKASSYAAQATTEKVLQFCTQHSVSNLVIKLRGVGYSKDAALKSVLQKNFKILQISETTQRPFNGCRQTKKRRI
jgi:small subunit ribosomal protein S11